MACAIIGLDGHAPTSRIGLRPQRQSNHTTIPVRCGHASVFESRLSALSTRSHTVTLHVRRARWKAI